MEAPVIAASIAAAVALIGGATSLFATYRLKVKEFRVTQIKARIDALEQAAVTDGPEANPPEEETQHEQDVMKAIGVDPNAIGVRLDAALYCLNTTEKQYSKNKWLLNPESHTAIENLLAESNELFGKLGFAKATRNAQLAAQLIPEVIKKTDELKKSYEGARLSSIERLYLVLNREIGI